MAQKLVYIKQNYLLKGTEGAADSNPALTWLTEHGNAAWNSDTNIFFHSVVFTADHYIITHGNVFNGNNDVASLEGLDLATKSMSINGSEYGVYTSSTNLPTIYAPSTVGDPGQVLVANAGKDGVEWETLNKVPTSAAENAGQVLTVDTDGSLKWANNEATDTTYQIKINSDNATGDATNGVDLGTVIAPTSKAGAAGKLVSSNADGFAEWGYDISTTISTSSTDTQVPTAKAVNDAIASAVTSAMVFQGSVTPTDAATKLTTAANGDTYKVSEAGKVTIDGVETNVKVGDVLIAKKAAGDTTASWVYVPSADETETFITVKNAANTASIGYDKASGEVVLGTGALAQVLGTNSEAGSTEENATDAEKTVLGNNTSSTALVTAAQVTSYIDALNYSTTTGTVTSVTPGTGLKSVIDGTTGTTAITETGTLKLSLASETALTGDKLYSLGVDGNGNLVVNVPWTDTTYTFGTTGTEGAAGISLTSQASSADSASSFATFKSGTGITLANDNGTITITNASPNVTSALAISAKENGGATLKFSEGTSDTTWDIIGSGATGVAYDEDNQTITISSTNSWRPVYAYTVADNVNSGSQILAETSTSTANLAFGSEFLWAEDDTFNDGDTAQKEIHLAWAEVDAEGNLTYAV